MQGIYIKLRVEVEEDEVDCAFAIKALANTTLELGEGGRSILLQCLVLYRRNARTKGNWQSHVQLINSYQSKRPDPTTTTNDVSN